MKRAPAPMDASPDALREARHAALRSRLVDEGLLPSQADRWIEAWTAEASSSSGLGTDPDSAAFYEAAHTWIAKRLDEGWRL